ncbi:unnamed protein product [Euphydryas editha]|uniref:Uncharacterized protein n=1 Tax=Euphydryas editha TaxID=104508 RepID=A0AAU9U1P9_EUPED|nr:unnamed protein product [Euphydryas editha]
MTNLNCTRQKRGNVNVEADELRNNLEMFVRPIKKMTGLFPNHEIEIQFDIEQNPQEGKLKRRANKNIPSPTIPLSPILSSSISTSRATSKTTADQDNQIVYMKDLKKALEDYEKKHNIMKCNKSLPSNEKATPTSENANGLRLSNILSLLKNSRQMHQDIPKPNEEELSWLKIQVPS